MPQFRIEGEGVVDYVSVSPQAAGTVASSLRAVGDAVADRIAVEVGDVAVPGGHGRALRLRDRDAELVLLTLDELAAESAELPPDLQRFRRTLRLLASDGRGRDD